MRANWLDFFFNLYGFCDPPEEGTKLNQAKTFQLNPVALAYRLLLPSEWVRMSLNNGSANQWMNDAWFLSGCYQMQNESAQGSGLPNVSWWVNIVELTFDLDTKGNTLKMNREKLNEEEDSPRIHLRNSYSSDEHLFDEHSSLYLNSTWERCSQCSFWIKYCLFTINFFVWVSAFLDNYWL